MMRLNLAQLDYLSGVWEATAGVRREMHGESEPLALERRPEERAAQSHQGPNK